jgi:hypothetical protein
MNFVEIDSVAQALTLWRQSAERLDRLTSKFGSKYLSFKAFIFQADILSVGA